eukprot:Pgem_evm1s19964
MANNSVSEEVTTITDSGCSVELGQLQTKNKEFKKDDSFLIGDRDILVIEDAKTNINDKPQKYLH